MRRQKGTPALDAPHDAQRESPQEAIAVKAAQNGHASPLALGPVARRPGQQETPDT